MILLPWIVVVVGLVSIAALLIPRQQKTVAERLRQVGAEASAGQIGQRARVVLPNTTRERRKNSSGRRAASDKPNLRQKFVHAGFYGDGVVDLLRLLRFALLGLAVLGGYLLSVFGMMPVQKGLLIGVLGGLAATIAPAFLLDYLKDRRQTVMRHALPDVLDVMVVCLHAGLSLPAALARVAQELAEAHPTVAMELKIVEREVQLGRSIGESMRSFANRFDLEELRAMSVVILQADRFGTRLSDAFQLFADSMRKKRQQRAEELAHKASVKLVFPTALFIFPAMFVVTLGPAIFQAMDVLLPMLFEADLQSGFSK